MRRRVCVCVCVSVCLFRGQNVKEERLGACFFILEQKLRAYYAALGLIEDADRIYEVHSLSRNLLGMGSTKPKFKTKGSETRTLIGWAVELAKEFRGALGSQGQFLVDAGEAMLEFYEVLRIQQRVIHIATRIHLFDLMLKHVRAYGFAGGVYTPKHIDLLT